MFVDKTTFNLKSPSWE